MSWLTVLSTVIKWPLNMLASVLMMKDPPLMTTLGLMVIDEIQFGSGQVVEDVLGGSGTYSILGARLFCEGRSSHSLAWLVRVGRDFPAQVATKISGWKVHLVLEKLPDRLSTRGLLVYEDSTFGPKSFKYTTPVLSVQPEHFLHTRMLSSRYLHTLCDPYTIRTQVEDLLRIREPLAIDLPYIVWEPAPPSCVPENLEQCFEHVQFVDVFSPNHVELLALFGRPETEFSREIIQDLAIRFLKAGIGRNRTGTVIIRAGEHGCFVLSECVQPTWLPPYYDLHGTPQTWEKIVDTTGAGNAFLGGYIVGHHESGDPVEAACYGTISASFIVEQISVPVLKEQARGCSELWNNENPRQRLKTYRARLSHSKRGSNIS